MHVEEPVTCTAKKTMSWTTSKTITAILTIVKCVVYRHHNNYINSDATQSPHFINQKLNPKSYNSLKFYVQHLSLLLSVLSKLGCLRKFQTEISIPNYSVIRPRHGVILWCQYFCYRQSGLKFMLVSLCNSTCKLCNGLM